MARLRDIAIIFTIMSLMTWAFIHWLDLELDIREAKTKHYMEGVIK